MDSGQSGGGGGGHMPKAKQICCKIIPINAGEINPDNWPVAVFVVLF